MLVRRLQRPGIFYGWVIVLVSFLIIAFVFGVRLSFGIFFDALTRDSDFGWSRADTAGVFSVTMLVFAATSTSIGWLLDRWGPRRVYSAGILIMASGLWLTSRMTSLLDFYLFYGVWTGLGITVLGLSMHAATIARWFDRLGRRGWPSAWPSPAAGSASWCWRPSSNAPSARPAGARPT
ncbi:MAG: MFS transporter [Caldilineaceae bacterium]